MAMLENVFSWSKSRDEQFRDCQRKYYYDKYLAWGGWDRSAPKDRRMAYVLKNLKNRWAWKGETVHHVIENVLKSMRTGQVVPLDKALADLTETMRKDYRSSKAKKHYDDPKRNIGLFEHEYERVITDDVWKKVHDTSADCIKNFYSSQLIQELQNDDPKSWLVIEDLEEFQYDNAKIYVKLDFAREKNGTLEIFDWKTGKAENMSNGSEPNVQMGTYALYAMQKWNAPLESIRCYLFNLSQPKAAAVEVPLTPKMLEETQKLMSESVRLMRSLLVDEAKNLPKPAVEFAFTNNTRNCDFCNFYKICDKYRTSS